MIIPLSKTAKRKYERNYVDKFETESGGTVRVYDEKHVKKRWKEKEKKIKFLKKNIGRLRKQYHSDLKSDDPKTRAIAALVGLMDDTSMRIGNDDSVDEFETFGATTIQRRHIKNKGGKLRFVFVGKTQVKQDHVLHDVAVAKEIRRLMEGKKGKDFIFEYEEGKRVSGKIVNRYLAQFDISAKDLRGYKANAIMEERLKKTKDWDKALKETAEEVGHTEKTLENQYLSQTFVEQHKPDDDKKDKKDDKDEKKDKKDKKKKSGFDIPLSKNAAQMVEMRNDQQPTYVMVFREGSTGEMIDRVYPTLRSAFEWAITQVATGTFVDVMPEFLELDQRDGKLHHRHWGSQNGEGFQLSTEGVFELDAYLKGGLPSDLAHLPVILHLGDNLTELMKAASLSKTASTTWQIEWVGGKPGDAIYYPGGGNKMLGWMIVNTPNQIKFETPYPWTKNIVMNEFRSNRNLEEQMLEKLNSMMPYWRFADEGDLFSIQPPEGRAFRFMVEGNEIVRLAAKTPQTKLGEADLAALRSTFPTSTAYTLTGLDFDRSLYHAGKRRIKKIDPGRYGERDEGWFGEGFYLTSDPEYAKKYYGPELTEFSVDPRARILVASIDAGQAPPGLFEAVLAHDLTLPSSDGSDEQKKYLIELLKKNQIEWVHAVDRFAVDKNFDIVAFNDYEVVIKTPTVLKVVKLPRKKRRKKRADFVPLFKTALDPVSQKRRSRLESVVDGILGEQAQQGKLDEPVVEQDTAREKQTPTSPIQSTPTTPSAAPYLPISSKYGPRISPITRKPNTMHQGLDLKAVMEPVYAIGDGEVIQARWEGNVVPAGFVEGKAFIGTGGKGWGQFVQIRHPNGMSSVYAHLSQLLVQVGQKVSKGQQIAVSGQTGQITGPHLHLEIRNAKGQPVDPRQYIK